MFKKRFVMLPCIAAVAIATFVGKNTFESHAYVTNNLLSEDIETLSNCESIDGKKNNGHCTKDDHLRYFCESAGLFDSVNCYQ